MRLQVSYMLPYSRFRSSKEVEGVAVLHQELAAAHDAEAGRISSRNLVWI